MKHGARNAIVGKVSAIKRGDIMSQVTFEVSQPATMGSVLTSDSLDALGLAIGDEVKLIIKAVHVLPVKD